MLFACTWQCWKFLWLNILKLTIFRDTVRKLDRKSGNPMTFKVLKWQSLLPWKFLSFPAFISSFQTVYMSHIICEYGILLQMWFSTVIYFIKFSILSHITEKSNLVSDFFSESSQTLFPTWWTPCNHYEAKFEGKGFDELYETY